MDGLWQVKNLFKILLGKSKRIRSHRTAKYMTGCQIRNKNGRCGQEPACEYGNELLGSIKHLEFKFELSNLKLFKTDLVHLVTLYHAVFGNRWILGNEGISKDWDILDNDQLVLSTILLVKKNLCILPTV
jgi:hypothetical protein